MFKSLLFVASILLALPSPPTQGAGLGEYSLYAWEDVDSGAWFNPGLMRLHENSGKRIRIEEAAKINTT